MRTITIWSGCLCLVLVGAQNQPALAQNRNLALPSGNAVFGDSYVIGAQAAPVQPPAPAPVQPAPAPVQPPAPAPVQPVPVPVQPVQPQVPATPQAPGRPGAAGMPPGAASQPPSDAFTQAPPGGTEAAGGGYSPTMLGDSLAYFSGFQPIGPNGAPITGSAGRRVPIVALDGAGFKIADDDSPRPQDRGIANFDYYSAVGGSLRSKADSEVSLAREVIGYERTFLDGDASLEFRLPFFESSDNRTIQIADLTLIAKYAIINTADTTLSTGFGLTLPTGPTYVDPLTGDKVDPTIVQLFVGYRRELGAFYVLGFSSLAISCSDTVPTVWFNDLGVGWYAYREAATDRISITGIAPTAELHLTTPFGHEGSNASPVAVLDEAITTLGVHVFIGPLRTLTLGLEYPLSGPRPFDSGFIAQFWCTF